MNVGGTWDAHPANVQWVKEVLIRMWRLDLKHGLVFCCQLWPTANLSSRKEISN
jgi:hypothetical protein